MMCEDHLKPAKEEGKLDGKKERVEQVQLRLGVPDREAVSLLREHYLQFSFDQKCSNAHWTQWIGRGGFTL